MRTYLLLAVFCLLCVLLVAGACSAQSPSINVRDFGAKGDGITDDTAAIQSAADAARPHARVYWNAMNGSGHTEVVFPEGVYLVSKPIVFANVPTMPLSAYVRGIGTATLKQTNPNEDIFYMHFAYRVTVDNLRFDGGKRSIKLWTNNMDTSTLAINNCSFTNSSDYAIECTSRLRDGKQVERYELDEDGSIRYLEDPESIYYFNSTVLRINNCDFKNCMRVLHANADGCYVENCRMETHPEMTGAAIRNGGFMPVTSGGSGVMILENVKCLFNLTEGRNQHWIENHNYGMTLRNVELKTDSGKGVCPIYNLAPFRTGMSTQAYVIVEDSKFAAAGSPENALVYCEEVSNLISIRNCESSNGTVDALGFPEVPDHEYFKMHWHCREPMPAEGLGYTVDAGNRNIRPNLPPSMLPFQRKPLSREIDSMIRSALTDREDFLSVNALNVAPEMVILAADYGVIGDGVVDDTEAIRKAVAAAAARPGSELQFPGGIYKMRGVIDLPPDIRIRGMGRAAFFAIEPGEASFRVKDARAVAFYNCAFESLSSAASMTVDTKLREPAKILFKNCMFSQLTGVAVECVAGDLHTDGSKFARLRITDAMHRGCRQTLVSNVSAMVDNNWVSTAIITETDDLRDYAFFENYGFMRFENAVGVPLTDAVARDIRYIDNYGRLFVTSIRFGGEYNGACAVNIKRAPGIKKNIAVIQDGWIIHQDIEARQSLVHCEAAPDLLVLRNNVGAETPQWVLGSQMAAVRTESSVTPRSMRNRVVFSGNTIPEDLVFGPVTRSADLSLFPPQPADKRTNERDGAEMVLVPAGEFTMGSATGQPDESPEHKVFLSSYWIYKHEVTVGQYRKFCEATGRELRIPLKPWNTNDEAAVIDVTWEEAAAYAEWAGGRLPTEAEWEKAARGTDGREYPWGNDWDRHKCQQYDAGYQMAIKVGSFPADLSPYGCFDMGGNVTEWCSDWYSADYYSVSPRRNPTGPETGKYKVIRGGGWSNLAQSGGIRSASRKVAKPDYHWLDIGFRVVVPYVEQ